MERELIMERTRAGLQAARRQGRVGGRKRQMTDSKIQATRKLLANGASPHEVAHSLGVSVPTLYRWCLPLHGCNGLRFRQEDQKHHYANGDASYLLVGGCPRMHV
jgi:DNA invertase Pin-like site-specific DNA recombinase